MGRCCAIIDPICAEHDDPGHPECNARLVNACFGIPRDVTRLASEPALPRDVERVHDPWYLSLLEQRCSATATLGWLDPDTYITRRSFDAALHAAGAAITAVERSLKGEHCFALVRPPGHHAEFNRAMGFCLINNVAVAAKKALEHVDTVAIVDWDVHHGNGTQNSFYGTDRVLYCSIHQEHFFPYSGTVDEMGTGDGKGYTINAPLHAGSTIADYYHVFSEIFVPAVERFSPEVMIISAGQDILFDDPLGMMSIHPQDFELLTRMLARAAGVPLALVLEGGYSPSHGAAVHHIFTALTSGGRVDEQGIPSERTQTVVSRLKSEHHLP
ncbi:MAG: histone deacetylase [Methanoregula sp.]|jgi:acetoin utilization deacetylase AcuC-like enzyme|nr:histone deacetylase [Methanoregula sp.]